MSTYRYYTIDTLNITLLRKNDSRFTFDHVAARDHAAAPRRPFAASLTALLHDILNIAERHVPQPSPLQSQPRLMRCYDMPTERLTPSHVQRKQLPL